MIDCARPVPPSKVERMSDAPPPPGGYPPPGSGDSGFGQPPGSGQQQSGWVDQSPAYQQQQPAYQQPYGQSGYDNQQQGGGSNGLAIAALVCGIIALLLSWIPVINFLSFILGLIAIVLGGVGIAKAKDGRGGKGLAIAGLVTGLLALLVGFLIYVGLANFANDNIGELEDLQRELEELSTPQN